MEHKARRIRTLGSKWKKTAVLLRSKEIRPFVPDTRRWTSTTLQSMLKKYKMVYVKPVHGSFGKGVIKAKMSKHKGRAVYNYHHGKIKHTFPSFRTFYTSIDKQRRNKAYLVQKGIQLLKWDKRPFDVRVMVQRTEKKPWKATGVIGRLAHPKRIVTNFHNQGKPLPIEQLLSPYLSTAQRMKYRQLLEKLSVKIAGHLSRTYPGFREIGVDIGIDPKFHPWVLEVNTAPDPYIFNQLKDKTMFRRVLEYAKSNGRFRLKKRSSRR